MTSHSCRRPLPDGWHEPVCPCCGVELRFGELIFSSRSLDGWDKGGTLVISQDRKEYDEAAQDEHLYCLGCLAEWDLPENYDFA